MLKSVLLTPKRLTVTESFVRAFPGPINEPGIGMIPDGKGGWMLNSAKPGDPPIEPIIFHSLVPPVREPGEPQPEIGEPETDEPVYDDEDEPEDTGGDDYDALERDLEELPIC
jgi:hypothetical protein